MNTVIIINHLNVEFDEVPEEGVEDGILELGIKTGIEEGEDVVDE